MRGRKHRLKPFSPSEVTKDAFPVSIVTIVAVIFRLLQFYCIRLNNLFIQVVTKKDTLAQLSSQLMSSRVAYSYLIAKASVFHISPIYFGHSLYSYN